MDDIFNCKRCNSNRVELHLLDYDIWFIQCNECSLHGPFLRDKKRVIELWNQRTSPRRPIQTNWFISSIYYRHVHAEGFIYTYRLKQQAGESWRKIKWSKGSNITNRDAKIEYLTTKDKKLRYINAYYASPGGKNGL